MARADPMPCADHMEGADPMMCAGPRLGLRADTMAFAVVSTS